MKFFMILTILLLTTTTMAGLSPIDPNNYIWVNYTQKNPIKLLYDNTYGVTLPCYARIGQCRINYTMLPPGWKVATDNSLLIPKSDIDKPNGFAVTATLSELTGQKIDVDLVLTIQNGLLSVQDKNQFLNSNSYEAKVPTYVNAGNSANSKLKIVTKAPDGFPSLQELRSTIKNGNIYLASNMVNQLISRYAPCQSRISYLNQILNAVNQKYNQNQGFLKLQEGQVQSIQSQIQDLQKKKNDAQKKMKNDKNLSDATVKIKSLNETKYTLQKNMQQYQFLADKYLANLKRLGGGLNGEKANKSQQDIEIDSMEEEAAKLAAIIKDATEKKKALDASIASKKLSLKVKAVDNNDTQLMDLYQSKYREYSDLAIDTKTKIMDIDQQLNSLSAKYNAKNGDVYKLQSDLIVLNQRLVDKQDKNWQQVINQIKNANQIYKLNYDNVKSKINILSISECKP